jgi:hypothetical protein
MAYQSISFPTLEPECHDTEARSLKKIDALLDEMSATLASLAKPGGAQVALTKYLYGISYTIPAGADLLDVSCYNPTDVDCWVLVMITPGAPMTGQAPAFPLRAYAHNNAYYEAMTSAASIPAGDTFSLVVSSTENSLSPNPNPVYLAVRHS